MKAPRIAQYIKYQIMICLWTFSSISWMAIGPLQRHYPQRTTKYKQNADLQAFIEWDSNPRSRVRVTDVALDSAA
jgi:hypothetical protein